jgi:hypothetical protein
MTYERRFIVGDESAVKEHQRHSDIGEIGGDLPTFPCRARNKTEGSGHHVSLVPVAMPAHPPTGHGADRGRSEAPTKYAYHLFFGVFYFRNIKSNDFEESKSETLGPNLETSGIKTGTITFDAGRYEGEPFRLD